MPSLPTVGGSSGAWGTELNDYLLVGHDNSGKHLHVFNVWEYGTTGGTSDDVAINATIAAAASNGGGIIQLQPILHQTSAAIIINANNIVLRGAGGVAGNTNAGTGAGLGATVIQPAAGANYDAIQTALPPVVGSAGYVYYGVGVENLSVDCSRMSGTTSGQGNGIHFYGVRYGLIQNVDVFSSPNWAFLLEGDSTNYAYNTTLINCINGGPSAAGFRFTNSEQCSMIRCISEGAKTACAATQPYSGTSSGTAAYQVYANVGWTSVINCTFGNLGTYTAESIHADNGETCTVLGCLFDTVRGPCFYSFSHSHIFSHNTIAGPCTQVLDAAVKVGGNQHVITGNIFQAIGTPNWTYCVYEEGSYAGNLIHDNQFVGGVYGTVSLNATSTALVHHNVGFNPQGHALNPPAAPTVSGTGTGGTLTAGTYQVEVTYVNAIGETNASTSGSATLTSGQNLQITSPNASGDATGWYAYVTLAGGSTYLRQQANGSPTAIGTNLTLTTNPTTSGPGKPPGNTTGTSSPAVPASGTAQTNTLGVDCMVIVSGGTVTAIAIGGWSTGQTGGIFRVPAGQTITLTYSVAPTWIWFGD